MIRFEAADISVWFLMVMVYFEGFELDCFLVVVF